MSDVGSYRRWPIAGIILAAGCSTRMGRPKQLLRIGGERLLSRVLKTAIASDLDKLILVLGYQANTVLAAMEAEKNHPKVQIIVNENYRDGMSTSLRAGLAAVQDAFPAIMVLLGDQPFVDMATVNLLLRRFRRTKQGICVPVYKGRRGLPVCFHQRFYDDIMRISGDKGARGIIRNHPGQVLRVPIGNPDCLHDIDDEKDLQTGLEILACKQ